jgi:hypothetical protein
VYSALFIAIIVIIGHIIYIVLENLVKKWEKESKNKKDNEGD